MYKIAILGCENSHADSFLKLISSGLYPDIEVIGVYSNEGEPAKKLNEKYGVPVLDDYKDAVGKVDGIMITARHGDNHYKYAKPYIDCGIPMFIDKPITCSEEEACAFMTEAKEKRLRLCGGSTCAALSETLELAKAVREKEAGELRGGSLACPIHLDSPYGGFYFYAQHLIEVMTTVFGEDVKGVTAEKHDGYLTFTAHYDNFNVMGTYLEKISYYTVSLYGSKSAMSRVLTFTPDSFRHEMNDMLDLLSGKPMKKTYESFVVPVFVMNAVLRSLESGKREEVYKISS
ncbi:MAG: Gfo/Idh/MocA family oxidoreductase [Clostridia bacterium]|nr:Gfo/Idh/MocA family oxidoreductase [Clostridia bacterium]